MRAIRSSSVTRRPKTSVPWSVRLLPHYALGVWSVITHAGCGQRTVLLNHGVAQQTADRVATWISVLGAAVTVPMILALVRVHIG